MSYKSYGIVAAKISMTCVLIFGTVVPALSPLVFRVFIDARTDLIVPAQTAFGPVAFLLYLWFTHRYGRERTMAEFLASADVPHRDANRAARPVAEPVADKAAGVLEPAHAVSAPNAATK